MIASLVRSGSIATIVLDDGGVNRLSSRAIARIDDLLSAVPDDVQILCVRSGREGIFAAGADMTEMVRFGASEADGFSRLGQSLMKKLSSMSCVTVAVVDGECHGGALDLISAFDLRIATNRSRFAHPGAKLGIVTGFAGTSMIPARVSPVTARTIFLGGRSLSAADALEAGLLECVVEQVDDPAIHGFLMSAIDRRTEILLARPLLAAARSVDLPQMSLLAARTRTLLDLQEKC